MSNPDEDSLPSVEQLSSEYEIFTSALDECLQKKSVYEAYVLARALRNYTSQVTDYLAMVNSEVLPDPPVAVESSCEEKQDPVVH